MRCSTQRLEGGWVHQPLHASDMPVCDRSFWLPRCAVLCCSMVPAEEGGVLWPHYHCCDCHAASCNRHRPQGCQEYYESQGYNNPRSAHNTHSGVRMGRHFDLPSLRVALSIRPCICETHFNSQVLIAGSLLIDGCRTRHLGDTNGLCHAVIATALCVELAGCVAPTA